VNSIPDPYKVLQVDHEAEDEVIEAAYRRLARKYHPDVAPGPEAQDRMVRINQAWEMLRDPIRRAAVDRARSRSSTSAARVAAADARARAASQSPIRPAPTRTAAGAPPPATGSTTWGFPGLSDPGDAELGNRTQFVSPDWTNGRSQSGHGYDASTMGAAQGEGAAGPPPGSPYGSVLNFGRYAGWSLGEIARADVEYLEWLDRMPIGRTYQAEIDAILRATRRRQTAPTTAANGRGLFRRR
jgi:curved DNA-binding protein CbpA